MTLSPSDIASVTLVTIVGIVCLCIVIFRRKNKTPIYKTEEDERILKNAAERLNKIKSDHHVAP